MERFSEVSPGILRGGVPSNEEINVLKNIWDVKRIISLDEKQGKNIDPICKKLDIEHLIIPLGHDSGKIIKADCISNIVKLLTENQPTYIHCIHGRDRTGLAIALYRIKGEGWSPEEALDEANSFEFGDGLDEDCLKYYLSVIKDNDKNDADIVDMERNEFDRGNITSGPEGSNHFSPIPAIQDFIGGYPTDSNSIKDMIEEHNDDFKEESKKRNNKIRLLHLKKLVDSNELDSNELDSNDAMAEIGAGDNINPMLRGISPEGVGPMGIMPYGNYYL